MKQGEYWRKRFQQMEESQNDISLKKITEIQEQFDRSLDRLDKEIRIWYQRLADNNGVSMAEAKKLLSEKELKEFRWSLEEYIQYAKENEMGQFEKQLENASARVHIGRLEALKFQTQAEMERLYGNYSDSVSEHIKDVYNRDFYHTTFEIQKGVGIGDQIQALDTAKVESIIKKPWAVDEKNFSERIWTDKRKLINTVHQSLSKMCITGDSPDRAIKEIQRAMNTSKSNASRIVMTESAVFANKARLESMKGLDVEEFEVVETLDSVTCQKCASIDGKHFPMSEYVIGVTTPPFHPNCRGCTCPYFDDEFTIGEERTARNEEGRTYHVPANMTYDEWKQTFVDGGNKKSDRVRKVLENTSKGGIMVSSAISGARNPLGDKAKEHAQKYYGLVRSIKTDVAKISTVTGMPEDEVQSVKNFIFLEKHDLGGEELEYFEPDYMMAESWQRLIEGNPEQHDITLLRHEVLEKELMGKGLSQKEAHLQASKKYNYSKEAGEYYAKIKKYLVMWY